MIKTIIYTLFLILVACAHYRHKPSYNNNALDALIIAEIAYHRGYPEIAVDHYIYLTRLHNDPALLERIEFIQNLL